VKQQPPFNGLKARCTSDYRVNVDGSLRILKTLEAPRKEKPSIFEL